MPVTVIPYFRTVKASPEAGLIDEAAFRGIIPAGTGSGVLRTTPKYWMLFALG